MSTHEVEPPVPMASATRATKGSPTAAPEFVFPIVGIGASAGGLEALEAFLFRLQPDSGMAFVIIQHLDPTQKGMLCDLLQRSTSMPVLQARNRLQVRPDHVYVIPPNRDMSVLRGVLHLFEPSAPRGLRLPIDFFLRSLADDCRQRAVGVILSGMGSDGCVGLRAIKENAGLTLAQDPATAAFDAMPKSAIAGGVVDIVASPGHLPERLVSSVRSGRHAALPAPVIDGKMQSGLEKVLVLLRDHNGQDFSLYKKTTLYRRIERRMAIHSLDRIAAYVEFLQQNPQEIELLFREFLIGVTSFFRDSAAWDSLRDVAFPQLFARHPGGRSLRAWVPGCSTGEEAYSLAMVFREAIDAYQPAARFSLQIFATDLSSDAIDRARLGHYPARIAAEVSAERLGRFLVAEGNGYQVGKGIREMVVFAPQNLIRDPPFTKLDLLVCRNLLIYFDADLQKRVLPLFHYSLVASGILFLGTSEAIGPSADLFVPLDIKSRIFRRTDMPAPRLAIDFPHNLRSVLNDERESVTRTPPARVQDLADEVLLRQFAPAAVLVNARGDIVYVNGRTGRYLEPAAGKANWNIHAMARDGLRAEIGSALQHVALHRGRVEKDGLSVNDDERTRTVGLVAHRIEEPEPLRDMVMIVFREQQAAPAVPATRGRAPRGTRQIELELELRQAREEVCRLREDMQASQEELRSANEELQSTNEELQSTNEELKTSKEEMQSLNEELQTVNVELQAKVDELSSANDDMQNLLDSTEIATVFLDRRLHVRRFTPLATRVFKLIEADAGRPLSDLATDLDYVELKDDAREVLRTLMFSEKQVPTQDGRWFSVRIMPYRTMDNVIDGIVITFIDVSVAKRLEAELRAALAARAQGRGKPDTSP